MRHAVRTDVRRNKLTLNTQRIGKRIVARLIGKKTEVDAVTNNGRFTLTTAIRHNMHLKGIGNHYDTVSLAVSESFQPFQSADNLLILDRPDGKNRLRP